MPVIHSWHVHWLELKAVKGQHVKRSAAAPIFVFLGILIECVNIGSSFLKKKNQTQNPTTEKPASFQSLFCEDYLFHFPCMAMLTIICL